MGIPKGSHVLCWIAHTNNAENKRSNLRELWKCTTPQDLVGPGSLYVSRPAEWEPWSGSRYLACKPPHRYNDTAAVHVHALMTKEFN